MAEDPVTRSGRGTRIFDAYCSLRTSSRRSSPRTGVRIRGQMVRVFLSRLLEYVVRHRRDRRLAEEVPTPSTLCQDARH
jgi:hypothetical protein